MKLEMLRIINPTSIILVSRCRAAPQFIGVGLSETISHGRRRLVEPSGHRSAAGARGHTGPRLISPRIYRLSMRTVEKNRKTATRRTPICRHGCVATCGDSLVFSRYNAYRENAMRDRDERRRGLPSRRPADFSWTRARDFILRMESNFAQS